MAIFGLSLDATHRHQSASDPDKGTPQATTFILRTLDSRIMGRIRDMATSVTTDPLNPEEVFTQINIHEMRFQTVMFGLAGLENFPDGKGGLISYKGRRTSIGGKPYEHADPDVVRRIPEALLAELAEVIRERNALTQEEAGNSAA